MKYIIQYLEEIMRIKPLGKVTTIDDNKYDLSGVSIKIDEKEVGIFVAHVDYAMWLESKIESI